MDGCETLTELSEIEAKNQISSQFQQPANIYAVLDDAVCFGIFQYNKFLIAPTENKKLAELDWKYLRELRVFDENQELLLLPEETGSNRWTGRIRRDSSEILNGGNIIKEKQKLWGHLEGSYRAEGVVWSLLKSERGTRIWIPWEMKEKEAAICVYKYLQIPDESEVQCSQNDIRMVGFRPWGGGNANE